MKRSPALTPLSHDHQHALDAALWLRRADPQTVDAAIERFEAFFDTEGRRHFEIEEEHVLGALPATDDGWAAGVARVRDDHAAIRAQAAALREQGGDPVALAHELGQRLHDHVRFEERVLFEALERRLEPQALERLGETIARAERG